jgi:CheY-like chemotaxis protein
MIRTYSSGRAVKQPTDTTIALRGSAAEADTGTRPLTASVAILTLTRDAATRDLLMEIAIDKGYGLFCASDGADAIRTLEHEPPALVVLDLDTPDGRALLRELRAEERWRGIPVFALTATNNPMVTVTIDAPVFFKPDLDGLQEAVVGRFESAEQALPNELSGLGVWSRQPPSA